MAARIPELPSPSVAFPEDFLPRLGALVRGLPAAAERREGAGRAELLGVGAELRGFRPYRHGEDVRQLDWHLYARLRKPFVRVARREASERWAVLLDTSASMGVGVPGKLQRAAEAATAIAAIGIQGGASVDLWTSARARYLRLSKKTEIASWMRFLEQERAQGERGIAALAREPARFRAAGRVFLVGDLLDLAPDELFAGLARRGRELFLLAVLAPEELAAPAAGSVVWVDAEDGREVASTLDRSVRGAYERELARRLEAFRTAAARHRARLACASSAEPFERTVETLFWS